MNYLEAMQTKAAKKAEPLVQRGKQASKALVKVRERVEHARQDVERRRAAIEKHRSRSTERLARSTSAFREWQGRLRRLEHELHSAEEALDLLQREVEPRARRDLDVAEKQLCEALAAAAREVRDECESAMAEHFDAVVREHDAFLRARAELFETFSVSAPSDTPPVIRSDRLDATGIHHTLGGPCRLVLTLPSKKPDD